MPDTLIWHSSPFLPPSAETLSQSLHHSLRQVATRWPKRPAVLHGRETFSFEELSGRAEGIAEQILASPVRSGPVALVQGLGVDAIAAWFACGLAGRPFLLLEPAHPPARLAELLQAAGAQLVVCDNVTKGNLPADLDLSHVVPDGRAASTLARFELAAHAPAMIFPTSGSTGHPKLVTYSAQTIQAKVQSSMRLFNFADETRVLIAGSHGNYGFLHHALVFLLSGNALCLADVKGGSPRAFLSELDRLDVRHVRFTPSLFRTIARAPDAAPLLSRLEGVRFSGEPLLKSDLELARRILNPNCLIQNVYGSTESALFIWSSGEALDPDAGTVQIGQLYPLSSYALRPLEDHNEDEDTGELIIRSAYHALGDWENGALNGRRFEKCNDSSQDRLFETKDIARRLPDGSLILLGRSERMAKIRGQRVFLSEVENHLRAKPGVTGAVVMEMGEEDGDVSLIAFVTSQDADGADLEARRWLARRLPDFMVPRQIIALSEIPLLAGGKVDFETLRKLVAPMLGPSNAAPLEVDDYQRLAQIWQSTLGSGAENPENDFFAFGGDSLKLMELSLAIERDFGRELSVEDFTKDPTLSGLAGWLGLSPEEQVSRNPSSLRFRSVAGAKGGSKGVALAMPGFHGSSHVLPFVEAGMFEDYDIWAADVRLTKGSLLNGGLWWKSALQIVRQIKSGDVPAPKVLFGYSLGGSIAWIVGRLLSGTPYAPDLVVMVDAAPMHRLPRYWSLRLQLSIAFAKRTARPQIHHVRREQLKKIGLSLGTAHLWQPQDGITSETEVAILSHQKMGQSVVLKAAVEGARGSFFDRLGPLKVYDLELGQDECLIRRFLIQGSTRSKPDLRDIAAKAPNLLQSDLKWPLIFLFLRDGDAAQCRAILEEALKQSPRSRLLHYAALRLVRKPNKIPRKVSGDAGLPSIRAVDAALSVRNACRYQTTEDFFTSVLKVVDIFRAIRNALL